MTDVGHDVRDVATVPDTRSGVTVVTGPDIGVTTRLADRLAQDDERLLVVGYDTSRPHPVRCAVTSGQRLVAAATLELAHCCLSCTIRDDLVPRLVALSRSHPGQDIVVVLPTGLEPQTVGEAIAVCEVDGRAAAESVRVGCVVAVMEPHALHDALSTDDRMSDRGMAAAEADERTVAEVVCRQVEYADTVVLLTGGDTVADSRAEALLECLAPWARRLTVDSLTGSRLASALRDGANHDPLLPEPFARGLEGLPLGTRRPDGDHGVSTLDFRTKRPFHPERLHDEMVFLTGNTVRGRGHLWLATQFDHVVAWESAGGGLSMGWLGQWLDALPPRQREAATRRRRVAAALDWDPYYADRHTHLVFVGVGIDVGELDAALRRCLLTDAEIAAGQHTWCEFTDPFEGRLGIVTDEPTQEDNP